MIVLYLLLRTRRVEADACRLPLRHPEAVEQVPAAHQDCGASRLVVGAPARPVGCVLVTCSPVVTVLMIAQIHYTTEFVYLPPSYS